MIIIIISCDFILLPHHHHDIDRPSVGDNDFQVYYTSVAAHATLNPTWLLDLEFKHLPPLHDELCFRILLGSPPSCSSSSSSSIPAAPADCERVACESITLVPIENGITMDKGEGETRRMYVCPLYMMVDVPSLYTQIIINKRHL